MEKIRDVAKEAAKIIRCYMINLGAGVLAFSNKSVVDGWNGICADEYIQKAIEQAWDNSTVTAGKDSNEQLRECSEALRKGNMNDELSVRDCIEFLREAGYDKEGQANTLWAMTKKCCKDVVKLQKRVVALQEAIDWLNAEWDTQNDCHGILLSETHIRHINTLAEGKGERQAIAGKQGEEGKGMARKFAKIFEDGNGEQILVHLTTNEEGNPYLKFTFDLYGIEMSIGPSGKDTSDKTWGALEKAFDEVTKQEAFQYREQVMSSEIGQTFAAQEGGKR